MEPTDDSIFRANDLCSAIFSQKRFCSTPFTFRLSQTRSAYILEPAREIIEELQGRRQGRCADYSSLHAEMFGLDPDDRPSAEQLLDDPFWEEKSI